LNVIVNKNIPNDNHGVTTDVQEIFERGVRRSPAAQLFKESCRAKNMKVMTSLPEEQTKHIQEIGRRDIRKISRDEVKILISQSELRFKIESQKAKKEWKKQSTTPMR